VGKFAKEKLFLLASFTEFLTKFTEAGATIDKNKSKRESL